MKHWCQNHHNDCTGRHEKAWRTGHAGIKQDPANYFLRKSVYEAIINEQRGRELTSLCLSFVVEADLGDNITAVTRIIGFQKAGGTGDRES